MFFYVVDLNPSILHRIHNTKTKLKLGINGPSVNNG